MGGLPHVHVQKRLIRILAIWGIVHKRHIFRLML
jgi:hypothetical protein